jgi:hypothetical protein
VAGQTGEETFLDVVKLNRRQAGRVEGRNESSHSKCKNAKVLICRCWSECMNYVCVSVVCSSSSSGWERRCGWRREQLWEAVSGILIQTD